MEWRSQLPIDSCVVELYEYAISKEGLCVQGVQVYVVVQNLKMLTEINQLSLPEAFLLIRDILLALQYLSQKFGSFLPSPSMIGVNSQGRAKMWINSNSAICSLQRNMIQQQSSQMNILNNIIRIISPKVQKDANFPVKYPKNLDFKSAL